MSKSMNTFVKNPQLLFKYILAGKVKTWFTLERPFAYIGKTLFEICRKTTLLHRAVAGIYFGLFDLEK